MKVKRIGAIVAMSVLMWMASTYTISVSLTPDQLKAVEYEQLRVDDRYVYLDDTKLDLAQKPVLIVDANSGDLVNYVFKIQDYKQPQVILLKEPAAPIPEFMTGLTYSICQSSEMKAPALLTWTEDNGLQGYMFNAIDKYLYKWGYPRLLGVGQVWNNTGDPSGNNSYRASQQSNFVWLNPGEEYSFYKYVLPSEEAGYQQGQSIFPDGNGGYTWGSDLGGGICKTATVLHYAVVNAGLTETERNHHSLQVSYALPGDDAAVSRGSADYRFINTMSNPIVIVFQQTDDRLMAGIYEVVDGTSAREDITEAMAAAPWTFNSDPVFIVVPKPEPKIVTPATLQLIDTTQATISPEVQATDTKGSLAPSTNNATPVTNLNVPPAKQ